ncbi:hypothetical protein K3175_05060 [Qipengyuania sp. GH1]|uniref:hypothetical protein n=1 Tax=Qipengyuania aestuarii TaxID=2867241 RepID=UPI001C87FDE2|nr:hypothetical protein [Qipengyuania aestuarii]MBX7535024.1 hypothetical protein [Qipengyuania aestuarii]
MPSTPWAISSISALRLLENLEYARVAPTLMQIVPLLYLAGAAPLGCQSLKSLRLTHFKTSLSITWLGSDAELSACAEAAEAAALSANVPAHYIYF